MTNTNGNDDPGIGHNGGELRADLAKAATAINKIDEQISQLQAEKREIKVEKVKTHGIKMADFNTVLRWWKLENEDRDETLDNIRMCCEALGIGGQGDLFPTPDEVAGADATV